MRFHLHIYGPSRTRNLITAVHYAMSDVRRDEDCNYHDLRVSGNGQ